MNNGKESTFNESAVIDTFIANVRFVTERLVSPAAEMPNDPLINDAGIYNDPSDDPVKEKYP